MRVPLQSTASPATKSNDYLLRKINRYRPRLERYEKIREHIHAHPELSRLESNTASLVADHLRALGAYEVHVNIGGHGVAAVCRNGSGPTVLLRADMDALPVKEQTSLSFASKVVMEDFEGNVQPVMHACGHDVHVTCMLAAAESLASMRQEWFGTLVLVFQPDEEKSGGAERMVDDGLYEKVPVPDIVLGQHVFPGRAGRIGMRKGIMMAASDSLQVTFHGKGGHASMPQSTNDPVIMAASCIMRLQAIVSRETVPGEEMAVVTVAKLQASNAENIIADEASISINVRTTDPRVRSRVLSSIRRIVKAESDASGAPKEPSVHILSSFPVTVNDEVVTEQLSKTFEDLFNEAYNPDLPRVTGSEDFSVLATKVKKPIVMLPYVGSSSNGSCFWFVSGTDPEKWDEAERKGALAQDIPVNHSPFFALMHPTIRVGTDALVAGALTFLDK